MADEKTGSAAETAFVEAAAARLISADDLGPWTVAAGVPTFIAPVRIRRHRTAPTAATTAPRKPGVKPRRATP